MISTSLGRGGAARRGCRLRRGRCRDGAARRRPRSAPCARPATMPSRCRPWASACSTMSRSAPCRRAHVHKLSRLAIFDFDVHHGNGTQATFWDDPDTLYVSTHQSPLYPGTGHASERGIKGNILNRPLPPGTGSDGVAAGGRARRAAGDRRLAARADPDLGRLRRPRGRPAGQHGAGRGRLRLGHARARAGSPTATATGGLSRCLEGGYDPAGPGAQRRWRTCGCWRRARR